MTRGRGEPKVWVTVYEVTRHYGGPEEGGWWYNWHDVLRSFYVPERVADFRVRKLTPRYVNEGNIYSVLGGTQYHVVIEATRFESQTTHRPHYE